MQLIVSVLWDQCVVKYDHHRSSIGHSIGLVASKTRLAICTLPFTQSGSKAHPSMCSPRFRTSFAGVLSFVEFLLFFCTLLVTPADSPTFLTVVRLVVTSFGIVVLQHIYFVACRLGYRECALCNGQMANWPMTMDCEDVCHSWHGPDRNHPKQMWSSPYEAGLTDVNGWKLSPQTTGAGYPQTTSPYDAVLHCIGVLLYFSAGTSHCLEKHIKYIILQKSALLNVQRADLL